MIEKRMIAVTAYRTPGGRPTCAANFMTDEVCRFMTFRKMSFVEVCACTGSYLRRVQEDGWLTPCAGCPVWADEVTE